jgi:hypothetical protein
VPYRGNRRCLKLEIGVGSLKIESDTWKMGLAYILGQFFSPWTRSTRCVFEKGAQNVAQPILCVTYCITFSAVNSSSKIWATSVIYNKATLSIQSPNLVKQGDSILDTRLECFSNKKKSFFFVLKRASFFMLEIIPLFFLALTRKTWFSSSIISY